MPRQLGELEDAVMTRVWQWNRPVTVREVLEDLQQDRSIAYTTVMTVMDNLHQKGWVRREVEGRAYRYTAVSTRAAYSAALMNEAWAQSDNPAAALVAFFGMMSPEQREALQAAVRMVQTEPSPSPEQNPEPAPEQAPEQAPEPAREPESPPETPSETPSETKTAGEAAPEAGSAPEDAPAPAAEEPGDDPGEGADEDRSPGR
ncbi:BlaI/MecI/CopY family transcriptional regulator [Streptomyces sp. SID5473]|uniref:Transcriptional regulator n=2 Tax=Streptomyces tsukubensis TaxID=83656 RepID=A0A7G3UCW5_STRT9|nr:BlaI/MecI/CopY family transcriptional regulator [Streptomyces tsukubensis]AZK95729.1 transcriptional regulator [Streptomyces tsukubensis]MYS66064.1 BlaI/MecI/CopY family transcriptional regulator [Streptomyces sp. SID5473]QKM68243.1 transcriptional regulator [Streptomyces tsukubensis NRRL18488]TAI43063.1 BlaI/MecI/CopY family transcriptional regulator [Streptomyces tsukubensis]